MSHEHVLGHLALAESLDGDLLSEFLGRGVDGDVHLGLVDLDDELDVVLVEVVVVACIRDASLLPPHSALCAHD